MAVVFGPKVPWDISAGQGPWFVQVWGIRSKYTWQDVKDMVRPAASHVGHVSVYPNGRATITVRKFDEALRCFEFLAKPESDGQNLYVELWETTPNCAPRLIWKNVERIPLQAPSGGKMVSPYAAQLSPPLMPSQQDILSQQVAPVQIRRDPPPPQPYQPLYQMFPLQQNTHQQARAGAPLPYHKAVLPQPDFVTRAQYMIGSRPPTIRPLRYATGVSGFPTNVENGTVRTERRGVFVSNLSYDVQNADIERLFSRHGKIVSLNHKSEFKVNSKGKAVQRSKGNAIITYATSDQAKAAVDELNGYEWNGRGLIVRYDTEQTPLDAPPSQSSSPGSSRMSKTSSSVGSGEPLIVDGSKYGRKV